MGNLRFIAELGRRGLVQEKILHECVKLLLSSRGKVLTGNVALEQAEFSESDQRSWRFATKECLCQFLTFVGSYMDKSDKAKSLMDQYFQRITTLLEMANQTKQETTNKHFLPSRIRFMMEDLLDLRANNWVAQKAGQRTNVDEPKLLSQLREETIASESDSRMSVSRPYHTRSPNQQNDVHMKSRGSPDHNSKQSLTKSQESSYSNGSGQTGKYTTKSSLQSVSEDDQDWRSSKLEGSWRKAVGQNMTRMKKSSGEEVWRRDGVQSSSNNSQLQNLPPRMMRLRLEGNGKMGRMDSINESSTSSSSPTSSGQNDFSRTNYNNSNISEIFGLKKPKTLFEPDYLRENKGSNVYLGPVDKFQRPLSQMANNTTKVITKPSTYNGKSTKIDNGPSKTVEIPSAHLSKYEIAQKIATWLESTEDLNDNSLNNILLSSIDASCPSNVTLADTMLDNTVFVELLILCCRSSDGSMIDKFIVLIDGLTTVCSDSPMIIVALRTLLSNDNNDHHQYSDLFLGNNDLFITDRLSKYLAHLVFSRRMMTLVSLAHLLITLTTSDYHRRLMVAVIHACVAMDPSPDSASVRAMITCNNESVQDLFQASDEEVVRLLEDSNLIYLVPDLQYKISLNNLMIGIDLFDPSFTDADCQCLVARIIADLGVDKRALKYSVDWIIEHVLHHIFDESNISKSTKDLIDVEKVYWRRVAPIIEHHLSSEDSDSEQLNIIYTLQHFWNVHKQPKGALLRCFICFYDLEMVDEDVFYRWKDDKNSKVTEKGKALFEVDKWLQWLKTADYIKPE